MKNSTFHFLVFVLLTTINQVTASIDSNLSIPPNDHKNFFYYAVQLNSKDGMIKHDQLLEKAKIIAKSMNYHFVHRVGQLDDCFLFATPKSGSEPSHTHVKRLLSEADHLLWVEEQIPNRRLFKRDDIFFDSRRAPEDFQQFNIKDPGFNQQWHLNNMEFVGHDLNVFDAWRQGISGKNATVAFLDDGLDYEHPDLKDNFYKEGSWDYNENKNLPTPKLYDDKHGTRCAGEVAAAKNDVCGTGIAWNARVSGIRILSGDLTEAQEAAAINHDFQNNDIYSCSWGPADDGMSMEAPSKLVSDAFYKGIVDGRGGLGNLFVFATGNGGNAQDNCNYDGYTNSIYTITVGAIDILEMHPTYAELCSAQLVVTYSGGQGRNIYTSDWPSTCTNAHGGTSAAAPLASGVYALILEIRPDLSWRDFQHLSVYSAVPISLNDQSWQKVAKGRIYSHKFGFGKLDASRIVNMARDYKVVNPQVHFTTPVIMVNKKIPQGEEGLSETFTFTEKIGNDTNFARLEHVTVTVTIDHPYRGDVEVTLTSPNGYVSQLGTRRPRDSRTKYTNWTFMTVKHWEENPVGDWVLSFHDRYQPEFQGNVVSYSISFWAEGTVPGNPVKAPIRPIIPTPQNLTRPTTLPIVKPFDIVKESYATITGLLLTGLIGFTLIIALILYYNRKERTTDDYEFQPLSIRQEVDKVFGDDIADEDDSEFSRIPLSVQSPSNRNQYGDITI